MVVGAAGAGPPVLRAPALSEIPGLVHAFCGRRGGVSAGPFAALNASARVGDAAGAVQENWRRIQALVPAGGRFAAMQQVHGTHVAVVASAALDAGAADALVTATPGVWLPVLTADCVPLLLAAPRSRVAAAAHAGWRGTAAGILPRTLAVLAEEFNERPGELFVAIGPAIDQCCYEVEVEIADALADCPAAPTCRHTWERPSRPGKVRVDLRTCLTAQLVAGGVAPQRIVRVGTCTRCAGAEFFSHRGAGGGTGRQVSFIGWEPAL
jgi:hypothetical protein